MKSACEKHVKNFDYFEQLVILKVIKYHLFLFYKYRVKTHIHDIVSLKFRIELSPI